MRPFELIGMDRIGETTWDCFKTLDPESPLEYRELAALVAMRLAESDCRVLGVSGGQGSGKSTLCALLQAASHFFGEKVALLSIDDFYKTKSERETLSREVHPLLATRGPPGTHDIECLNRAVRELVSGSACEVPVFDKGLDDRTSTRTINAGSDRVVVEGWCVGVLPEPSERLVKPINELEELQDLDGRCREWINEQIGYRYMELADLLDQHLFLSVPDIECVRSWRYKQENERHRSLRMDRAGVARFVQHYERITLWMNTDLPNRADIVVGLDRTHRVERIAGMD